MIDCLSNDAIPSLEIPPSGSLRKYPAAKSFLFKGLDLSDTAAFFI